MNSLVQLVQALKQELHLSEEQRARTERKLLHEKMENRKHIEQTEEFYQKKLSGKELEFDQLQ